MATIKEQSKAILSHPYFSECLEKAIQGDMSGFDRLFFEIQCHCWEKVALEASRVYGQWHRANHCTVKSEIRNLPPPTNLDIRLPFVIPKVKKPTIVIKTIIRHKHQVNNPNQLLLNFPEVIVRHLKIA